MQLIDVIRQLSADQRIMVGVIRKSRSKIMKVGNISWSRLRELEYRNVYMLKPCIDKHGKPFLYIGTDDAEKSFYNRR